MKRSIRSLLAAAFFLLCLCAALAPTHRPSFAVGAAPTDPPAPTNAPAGGLFSEKFTNATTAPGNSFYYALSTPSPAAGTQNPPCLTAAPTMAAGSTAPPSGTVLPGCPNGDPGGYATALPDPVGTGTLRLTDNSGNQAGFVLYNKAFSSGAGAQIVFTYWSYNGSGADGLAVFLIDGSQSPLVAGAYGGSLGYAQKTGIPGIVGGVIGVGLDEYGNWSAATEGRVGGPGALAEQIAIRGNAANQYTYIAGTDNGGIPTLPMSLNFSSATSRGTATARLIRFTISALGEVTVDASFTGTAAGYVNIIPPQVLTNQTMPSTLKLGFTGSTGGSTDIHEVQGLYGDPAPPDPALTMTQNVTSFVAGGTVVYTLNPINSGAGGTESKQVTITDVLPASLTYTSATGTGWACSATGQTVTCTITPTAQRAGTSYNPITLTTKIASGTTSGSITNTATIASPDDLYYGNDTASSTGQFTPASAPLVQIFKRIIQILTLGPTPTASTTPRLITEPNDGTNLSGMAGTATAQAVYPGDYITYGLYLKNVGATPAYGPTVSASSLPSTGPIITDTVDSNFLFDQNYTPAPTFSCCVSPAVSIGAAFAYNPDARTLTWSLSSPLPVSSPSSAASTNPIQAAITYTVKVP